MPTKCIAYYGGKLLFCGDTLFACGCGRLFEGTPEQMWTSLSKLAALTGDTQVYCGHEYTLANIRFAKAADPNNETLLAWEREASQQRDRHLPTLPSTIARERAANPFLRAARTSLRVTRPPTAEHSGARPKKASLPGRSRRGLVLAYLLGEPSKTSN